MKRGIKIFVIYIFSLLFCSVVLGKLHINSDRWTTQNTLFNLQPILIPTMIGGLIALKLTVPSKAFKAFIIIYVALWIFRIVLLTVADKIGETEIAGRVFRFDLIIRNYYKTASRLETPLPFIIFWFIYHFYTMILNKGSDTSKNTVEEE